MPWLPKKSVIVPVDFSDESLAAIDTALVMVEQPAQVHAVYVLPPMEMGEPGIPFEAIEDDARRHHARTAFLERTAATPARQGVNFDVLFGDPGHEIAEFARRTQAELIVIPSHGRTGLTRLLIGSVAERVVRLSHCPVLVLRK